MTTELIQHVWKGDDYEVDMRVIRQSGSDRIEIWKEHIDEELVAAIRAAIDAQVQKHKQKSIE